jgi:MFS family permease
MEPVTPPSRDTPPAGATRGQLRYALLVLFGLNFMNFYDRQVIAAVGEKIKLEWQLSDGQLAGLTTAFVLLYAVIGVPLGRLADTGHRRALLTGGVAVWSAFTALSGAAGSFATHVLCRMGVGVGEASLAPAANSLIADLFPPHRRARALSLFMLGLPLGLGASYLISGVITKITGGWRPALFVAAAPGAVLAVLAYFIHDAARPANTGHGPAMSTGTSLRAIVQIPAMRWIIASGALVNLALYAVSAFAASYYIRYHGLDIDHANRYNALVFGCGGGLGMVLGGWLSDRAAQHGAAGRLRVAALGAGLSAPLFWLALQQPRGQAGAFAGCLFAGVLVLYLYYSTVYAAIHDLVPASVRGLAMSTYFFVFYIFTAIGLLFFGRLSDSLAQRAIRGGATLVDSRAVGLHDAMYAIPVFATVLVVVLLCASRSVRRDGVEQERAATITKATILRS